MSDLLFVLPNLRPGSKVGFFFDDRIRRRPLCEKVEAEIRDLAMTTGEVVLGKQRTDGPELQIDFLEVSEISEALSEVRPGEILYYGVFPTIEDDGISCVAFIPPDPDGTVRPQPV
jgi:hypothetical protein